MIDGPRSCLPKNTALAAQPKATPRIGGSLNTMAEQWNPYHHQTMRRDNHNSAQTKQQPKQSTIPTHPTFKTKNLGGIPAISTKTEWVEQDTRDRCTDHEDIPRPTMMVAYSDSIKPTMPGPNTVNGACRRCFIVCPNIVEPLTLFASPTR